ncbi:hypothetical protein CEUSTIGMA_g12351.t1 [Chlamydomonas eustigma]|uniref:Uncharacterized protein n=1 Tax=Chlamydomonas eustigma TaxID=1157962 RepID=A0A250XQ44_9CHLO|nr:hypothetical protein CEUSTIGMA_g12351.t1 [Chlamydomonas eustigma]|eukprot:GAX84930.1 hypothetical protein CEUSTIGMA_g12351.t1 [Chlamydomonas eustigma]
MAVVDLNRTSCFALLGLTMHGPFFYYGYRWLIDTFTTITGPPSLKGCINGTLITGGNGSSEAVAKVQNTFLRTFCAGFFFWPVANVLNVMFVPATKRVLFVNGSSLVWNAYLRLVNSKPLSETAEGTAYSSFL